MAHIQTSLPACCSVGIMYGFPSDYSGVKPSEPNVFPRSGTFIAVFRFDQKVAYDELCKRHTLLSVATSPGEVGPGGPKRLAICVFQRGKRK